MNTSNLAVGSGKPLASVDDITLVPYFSNSDQHTPQYRRLTNWQTFEVGNFNLLLLEEPLQLLI
jgi:hypothetical protein